MSRGTAVVMWTITYTWGKLNQALSILLGSLLRELNDGKYIGRGGCERLSGRKFTFAWNILQKAASLFFQLGKSPFQYVTSKEGTKWQASVSTTPQQSLRTYCISVQGCLREMLCKAVDVWGAGKDAAFKPTASVGVFTGGRKSSLSIISV